MNGGMVVALAAVDVQSEDGYGLARWGTKNEKEAPVSWRTSTFQSGTPGILVPPE